MPAPTLDGSATGTRSSANNVAATLTTTQANDVVIAVAHFELNSTLLFGTGVSGGGLTWHFRSRISGGPSAVGSAIRQTMEIWWAAAPSALSAQTITLTTNANFDDASMVVFGVSGCNTTNPWEPNISLPGKQPHALNGVASISGVSTTNANDFLIYAVCSSNNNPGTSVPAGFTSIGNAQNGGGSNFSYTSVGYLGVTSVVNNQTYTWGGSPNTLWMSAVEALTADPGGTTVVPGVDLEYLLDIGAAASPASITHFSPTANDTLLIVSYATCTGAPAISGISGGGLTWTRRIQSHSSPVGSLEIWAAMSSTTLANFTANVTYASVPSGFGAQLYALALSGTTAAQYDANASVPAHVSNSATSSWTPSVTVSTTQAHDLLLATVGLSTNNTAAQLTTPPSGFRPVGYLIGTQGGGLQDVGVAYQRRSTTLSSAALAWGAALSDGGASAGGEYVVDALTADAAGGGTGAAAQALVLVLA